VNTRSARGLARFMRSLGVSSLDELQRRSVAEPDWYWDAVVRDLGLRFLRPYTRVRDVSRGVQWPKLVRGRSDESRRQLRGSPRRQRARRPAGAHLGRGRRPHAPPDLPRAGSRGESARERAQTARHRRRRPRRRVPADVARGGDRDIGDRSNRRDLHAVLLGLRRSGRGLTAPGLRGEDARHRRRLLPPRSDREDEGNRRRGRGGVPVDPERDRVQAPRPRDPVDSGPRSLVARADRAGIRGLSRAARLVRSSVSHHLHVGHDGPAEGRGAHAGGLPAQVRPRLRLPDGRRPGRPALLADRPRLAHGPDAHHRGALPRRQPPFSSRACPIFRSPIASGHWSSGTRSR